MSGLPVVQFPRGIPGFEEHRQFQLVETEHLKPLLYLASVPGNESLDNDLRFLVAPIALLDPAYRLHLGREDAETLQPESSDSLLVLAVVAVPDNGPPTANLLAPVVINPSLGIGVQAVRPDTLYSHSHPVGEEAECL